jgi:hypothetical protein
MPSCKGFLSFFSQEKVFNLDHAPVHLVNVYRVSDPFDMVRCQYAYARNEVKTHDYATIEPETSCMDYCL